MILNSSRDWIIQQDVMERTRNKLLPTDFYWEQGRMIFTESYHSRRGSCCGSGCRHCPYEPSHQQGNTTLKKENHDNKS
jgi:hypothetical protein